LLAISAAFIFASCDDDDNDVKTNALIGNWKSISEIERRTIGENGQIISTTGIIRDTLLLEFSSSTLSITWVQIDSSSSSVNTYKFDTTFAYTLTSESDPLIHFSNQHGASSDYKYILRNDSLSFLYQSADSLKLNESHILLGWFLK
jgi:hypothetical protein